ncbi:20959_t:CDS:1, partial [Gigaspora margarita]
RSVLELNKPYKGTVYKSGFYKEMELGLVSKVCVKVESGALVKE